MSGRHVNDRQMRLFMKYRQSATVPVAVAKAGFSPATGYRLAKAAVLPSEQDRPRGRRRPDPIAAIASLHVLATSNHNPPRSGILHMSPAQLTLVLGGRRKSVALWPTLAATFGG